MRAIWVLGALLAGVLSGACQRPSSPPDLGRRRSALLGEEHALSAPPVGPSFGELGALASGSDGVNSLVAWGERRKEKHYTHGTVVGAQGPLAPLGTRVSPVDSDGLSVAFGAGAYVVLSAVRLNPGTLNDEHDLWLTRVDPEGNSLGDPVPLTEAPMDQREPAVAFDGSGFVAVWIDTKDSAQGPLLGRIYARHLALDGTPDGPEISLDTQGSSSLRRPSVIAAKGGFSVVWQDDSRVVFRQLDSTGAPADAGPTEINVDLQWLDISNVVLAEGDRVVVVSGEASDKVQIKALKWPLSGQGAEEVPLATIPLEKDPLGLPTPVALDLALAPLASGFVAAWASSVSGIASPIHLTALRLDKGLNPTGPSLPLSETGARPSLSVVGQAVDLAWTDLAEEDNRVMVARINADGPPEAPVLLSQAKATQGVPSLTQVGDRVFAVWSERHAETNEDLLATFLDGEGKASEVFPLVGGPLLQRAPAVTFDGDQILMAWEQASPSSSSIRVARVSKDGTLLDPEGLPAFPEDSSYSRNPAVASGAGRYLLATGDFSGVSAVLLDQEAKQAAGPWVLDGGLGVPGRGRPIVVWGGVFVVLWHSTYELNSIRISASGELLDPTPVTVPLPANQYIEEENLTLAYGGGQFLLAYRITLGSPNDLLTPSKEQILHVRRFTPQGVVLGDVELPTTPSEYALSAAFDGQSFLLATQDLNLEQIRSIRIGLDGNVSDLTTWSSPVQLGGITGLLYPIDAAHLSVSTDCAGHAFVGYQRFGGEALADAPQAFVLGVPAPYAGPSQDTCGSPPPLGAAGASGQAGAGAGGASGDAGNAGAATTAGQGGTSAGEASSGAPATSPVGGASSGPAEEPIQSEDGGCGCRLRGGSREAQGGAGVVLALALLARRRKRPLAPEKDGKGSRGNLLLMARTLWNYTTRTWGSCSCRGIRTRDRDSSGQTQPVQRVGRGEHDGARRVRAPHRHGGLHRKSL